MKDDRTILKNGECHPATDIAIRELSNLTSEDLLIHREAFASCAIEGNRLAEVCLGTLNRLMKNKPVGERYLLGLCVYIFCRKVK